MKLAHFPSLPEDELHSPARKFHSFCRNVSLALGGIRNAGTWGGGHPFDFQVRRIPPGAAVCPFHSHLAQWELFVVRSGSGTVRAGDETHVVQTGDVFVHPPGEPHQLINSGDVDLEVFIFADNPPLDACYYPDSHKWGLRPPGKYFRMNETGYFDGEEDPLPDAPPYQPSGSPPPPPLIPFSKRKLHPDTLPWESWQSPTGKFRGTSKELSIGLGALRNQPTGLGGHPFDLELTKFLPGETGYPFHSHAAQWEMYIIISGSGTARVGDNRIAVRSGHVLLHPPTETHQLINTGTEDLIYFTVADNPSVDYFYYPDSGRWGLNPARKFFRPVDTPYWEDES